MDGEEDEMILTDELLKQSGFLASKGFCVFGNELHEVAKSIRLNYPLLSYDHRQFIAAIRGRLEPCSFLDEFRVGYACFKYSVAKIIGPKRICEIGVGAGVSALAFLHACPSAHYVGIDNGSKDWIDGFDYLEYVSSLIKELKFSFEIVVADSQKLEELPGKFDLVHIDGDHSSDGVAHDLEIAWNSGSPWILLDDCRAVEVVAGFGAGMRRKWSGIFDWAYFEDTWTGSILIHRKES